MKGQIIDLWTQKKGEGDNVILRIMHNIVLVLFNSLKYMECHKFKILENFNFIFLQEKNKGHKCITDSALQRLPGG